MILFALHHQVQNIQCKFQIMTSGPLCSPFTAHSPPPFGHLLLFSPLNICHCPQADHLAHFGNPVLDKSGPRIFFFGLLSSYLKHTTGVKQILTYIFKLQNIKHYACKCFRSTIFYNFFQVVSKLFINLFLVFFDGIMKQLSIIH